MFTTGTRRAFTFAAVATLLVLSACAKNASPSSSGTSGGSSTTSGNVMINSSSVSGVGTVLTNAQGFTLYHLKTETKANIQCTGSCTGTWPPVLVPAGSMSATAGGGVSGALSTFTRPDGGTQVTYNGVPLYTYSGDTSAGQANGQGIQGVWYAVTASGSGGSSSGGGRYGSGGYGSGSSPSPSGGYGY
jgi:predicted lipoprotein with Yx(FWY)xxD motif